MESKTICLAFLQNMWVKNPERVKATIKSDGEAFRMRFMRYALFAGCKTGRILTRVFGEELLELVTFEETTREIAGDPKTIFPADLSHIKEALEKHRPIVVLTLGQIARESVLPLWSGPHVHGHHPASRHPDTINNLTTSARLLREILVGKGAL